MLTTIPGYSITSELLRFQRSSIYRAVHSETRRAVLIKVINRDYPTFEEIASLKGEYQMLQNLGVQGLINVLELVKQGNRLALVMEDVGGDPLHSFGNKTFPLKLFFPLSIKLAQVIGAVHRRQVIHRNINPSVFLFNPDSGDVRLMEFENATELSQELKNEQIPKILEGSLPYISPEQTGRMNRDVDYLTDYYSLGATFYHLLTGQPPFQAEDTMGWIYSHITKTPEDPAKINAEVPKMVTDIIFKLMAKNPEDRYQSMQGLIRDLETCQSQWLKNGYIPQFTLAESDFSDQFQIPQKLYGREDETEALMNAFKAAVRGRPELLLIAGFSGIGKSALVNEIRVPILRSKGYFIAGENDQLKRNKPYSSITMAFHELIRRLLAEPNDRLEYWRKTLLEALEPNGQIILELVPELEKIIGKQPPVQHLNPTEAHNRFQITFRKFVQVFATKDHPLVIFLDDLQWTDSSTLDVVTDLITQEGQYLLIIGSYRNNEVTDNHPLMVALDEIQKTKFIKRLFLHPLKEIFVTRMVMDSLHCSQERATPLSELIYRKTNGNPFFVKELLKDLHKDDYIRFDYSGGCWDWDLERIRALQVSDNVVRFVINRVKRLPQTTQYLLQLASCIGSTFDLKTLGLIAKQTPREAAKVLWDAIIQGILIPLDDRYRLVEAHDESNQENPDFGVTYKFSHDRIQQAFYSLIETSQKETIHLAIGRLMLQMYNSKEQEQVLVDLLFQFNEGRRHISDPDELKTLAGLNLTAGKKAKGSSAYQAAYQYLKTGLDCISGYSWDDHYDLQFELNKEFSETAYLCGEFKLADEQCKTLLHHAATKLEKAEILRMQSLQYTIRGELEVAISKGIEGLALLGVRLSADPGRVSIGKDLLAAKFNLGTRKIADLEDQPVTTEATIRTCLKMLIELGAPAYLLGKERLFASTVLKGINFVLKYGNSPEAPMCYVPYGFLLGSVTGDWKSGFEFGKLGYRLNERFNNLEQKSKVIFFYTVFVHAWNSPWKSIPGFLKKAIEAAYQSGDLFYLAYSSVQMIPWDPEIDLATAIQQGETYLRVIKETKYEDAWYSAKVIQQLRLNLRGLTNDPFSLDTPSFSESAFLKRNQTVGFVPGIALYHLYKLQIHFTYEDYQSAVFHAAEAEKPMGSMFGLPYTIEYCLYSFLAAAAAYSEKSSRDRNQFWKRVKTELRRMKKWSEHCPENFGHHFLLMEAEMARITGRVQEATDYYNQAIAAAQANGFLRYEALANELAAKLFLQQNQYKIASTYMRDALYGYDRWGATAKVNQLKKVYADLFPREDWKEIPRESLSSGDKPLLERYPETTREVLDLNTISKAAQILSGEVVLEKLLQKLMYIVRENAGAEKVILILREKNTGELLIQAESIGDHKTVVLQSQPLEESESLSVAIVRYVARSLENVVLKDATRQGNFMHDHYVSKYQPKSVLCIPITNQGILVGVLYLENNLSADAFTPGRLKVLNLLSAQAAIAIQNAILYRMMEQKVAERTREIKELLDKTGQGFLTFDHDFKIHKQYSKACELFFGRVLVDQTINQEKGVDFVELIIADPKEQAQIKKLFEAVLSEKVSLEAIVQFFPDEISLKSRVLSLDYKVIHASQAQQNNRIMVILTDVTREKELADQLERDEERNRIILQIVKDRQGFLSFLKSFTSTFRNIDVTLKKEPADIDVDKLFRFFHTIKGGAANFDLKFLVEKAHEIESILYQVRTDDLKMDIDLVYKIKQEAIELERVFKTQAADFGNFIPEEDTVYMESIYKIPQSKITDHRQFILENLGSEAYETMQSSIDKLCKQPIKPAVRGFVISAQTLAEELGKKVEVEVHGEQTEVQFDQLNHLLSTFVHLVRNAIDHGIELPEERLAKDKPEHGLLRIDVSETEGLLQFVFEDDGRGIDEQLLVEIAAANKLVEQDWLQTATSQERLEMVFLPGFSSKKEISHLSGRGVGMDVVKAAVEELSGKIEISTQVGKGTRLSVTIPADGSAPGS